MSCNSEGNFQERYLGKTRNLRKIKIYPTPGYYHFIGAKAVPVLLFKRKFCAKLYLMIHFRKAKSFFSMYSPSKTASG